MSKRSSSAARQPLAGARAHLRLIVALAGAGLCVLGGLLFIACGSLPSASTTQPALGRGVIDYRLEQASVDPAAIPAMVKEMGTDGLGATYTRVLVHWAALQPTDGPYKATAADANADGYADAYVAQLDTIVDQLHAAGINVILTPVDVPRWASDKSLWGTQPNAGKGYQPYYAMRVSDPHVLAEFQALGKYLASHYAGKARLFECWNEPNLGNYLYPQNLPNAPLVGARTYLKMLQAYSQGVRSGAGDAVVIAGATAPRGTGKDYSTAPQVFARYLKDHNAQTLFDAYSHHPYTPGGTRNRAPGGMPNNLKRCVTLGNLSQLTSLFPNKPFYLTEYGYNTHNSMYFGISVSPATQARYLNEAYALVARKYPQVKALLWFLVNDWGPNAANPYDGQGVYTGLCTVQGERKPAWYAFAGQNKLTLTAPGSTKAATAFSLSGDLTCRAADDASGQTVTLESQAPGSATWTKVAGVLTRPDGSYSFSTKQSRTLAYQVVWDGVCQSPTHTVRTP